MKTKITFSTAVICFCIALQLHSQAPNWAWAKNTGWNDAFAKSIITDASGNIYVAGRFGGTSVTFGSTVLTNTNANYNDLYVAKYDANGNVLWAKQFGGSSDDYATSITCDASGNIYISGYFTSPSIVFGSTTLTNTSISNMFVTKLDAAGNVTWSKSASGTSYNEASAVATDLSGNVFVAGSFSNSSILFGATTLSNAGATDLFIVKYDASGTELWANGAGGANAEGVTSIAADVFGNVFIAGSFYSSTLSFGSLTLNVGGYSDAFLAKYNSSGTVLWANGAGGTSYDAANSVATDALGNAYLAGSFNSSQISFNTPGFNLINFSTPEYDIFISKYDPAGNVTWSKKEGGTLSDYAYSIAVNTSGNFFLAGYFNSASLALDTFNLANTGLADLFVAKHDTSNSVLWVKGATGTSNDYGYAVTVDNSDNVYVAGAFQSSTLDFSASTISISAGMDMFLAKLPGGANALVEFTEGNELSAFPNPANNNVTIQTQTIAGRIDLFDMTGRIVTSQQPVSASTTIQTSDLAEGVYLLRIRNGNSVITKKLVVAH